MRIRPYTPKDYSAITQWCKAAGISTLTEDTLPWSTFIVEDAGKPVASLSLICSNAKEYAYLEYAIGNPEYAGEYRRNMFKSLVEYIEGVAKQMGYKHLVCHATQPKLETYYHSMGYQPNLRGVTTLVKEI